MNYLENNLWFPYFSIKDEVFPIKVSSAKGSCLFLENGRVLVDGIASWWAMCHGYNHPNIIDAIHMQSSKLCHVMFGGILHDMAVLASSKLVNFVNFEEENSLQRAFFSDSGSTAVEVGVKMALQYFFETGKGEKNHIIYFENGYHGETFGALSFSHSMHSSFPALQNRILMKIPENEEEFIAFEKFIEENKQKIAGAIIEPILQGAGGMKIFESTHIKRLWNGFKKAEILIIADECATGFYRLKSRFAFWEVGITPDILILGKALTGGHLPLATTIAKEFIFQGICKESRFFHGPTFMANPTALACVLASLELFEKEDYSLKVAKIEEILRQKFPVARIKGAVCAFEISKETNLKIKKAVSLNETKSFLRPFANVLYTMPPLVISEEELEIVLEDMKFFANQ